MDHILFLSCNSITVINTTIIYCMNNYCLVPSLSFAVQWIVEAKTSKKKTETEQDQEQEPSVHTDHHCLLLCLSSTINNILQDNQWNELPTRSFSAYLYTNGS